MPLFDDMVRTETRPRRQNEGAFDYLNTSVRPGICAIRNLLENWFAHLPEAAKADIRGRFREDDEVQHQSAFFELFWHELLRCGGYEVEVHPAVANATTSPDFLAWRDGDPHFYLEATLAMSPRNLPADRRLAELRDTLDRMDSPDYFLEIRYRGSPKRNIPGRVVRERLQHWLGELRYDEISRLWREHNYGALPTFTWPDEGVILIFTPIPKSPETRGRPEARPIGIVAPEARWVSTHDDIRAAIDGKAAKYGSLELPLVIAVNVMDDLCDDIDIMNALFGEEQIVVTRQPDMHWKEDGRRVPNGTWRGRAGPRNTLVSAVAITHHLLPSTLRSCAVHFVHNPWATYPLPLEALPLAQRVVSLPDGHVHPHAGMAAADILDIPRPWPVPDEA